MQNVSIETPRLVVRSFVPGDAEAAAHYSRQPSVAYWMSDMVMHSESEALRWIDWINRSMNLTEPFVVLAIEEKHDARCIGVVGVHAKAEIGYEVEVLFGVSDEYQGKGYATEAAQALIEWVFENTNLAGLSAIVKPDNCASKRVIEKLGFTFGDTRRVEYDGDLCLFDYFTLSRNGHL